MRSIGVTAALVAVALGGGALGAPAVAEAGEGDESGLASFASDLDLLKLRLIAVQDQHHLRRGRVKPLDTFARERVYAVTGQKRVPGEDPVVTLLQMLFEPDAFRARDVVLIRHPRLVEMLTGRESGKAFVSLSSVAASDAVQNERRRIVRERSNERGEMSGLDPFEQQVLELLHRDGEMAQTARVMALVPIATDEPWLTVEQAAARDAEALDLAGWFAEMRDGFRARDAGRFNAAAVATSDWLKSRDLPGYPSERQLRIEYWLNALQPMLVACIAYGVGCLLYVLSSLTRRRAFFWLGFLAHGGGLSMHLGAMLVRSWLAERAAVASLYETIIWMGMACVLTAFVFEAIYRQGSFGLAATLLGGLAMMIGEFPLDAMEKYVEDGRPIDPLVPVLATWWLNVHVTCMITSYGCLLLAFGVSCVYLVKLGVAWLRGDLREGAPATGVPGVVLVAGAGAQPSAAARAAREGLARLDHFIYKAVQIGFVFLTAGVILGAVWANQSWGRYWGWDPKETWAFVTWTIYAAFLHARFMGWTRGIYAALMNVCGFAAVMFTYIGVGFLLPGLHSYLSENNAGPGWLGSAMLIACVVPPAIVALLGYANARSARAEAGGAPAPSGD